MVNYKTYITYQRRRSSLLQTREGINFSLFRMYVTPYRISWVIFTQLIQNTNCALLVADSFFVVCLFYGLFVVFCCFFVVVIFFAIKEIPLLLFQPIILRHLTQRLDIQTIFLILPILISKEWSTKCIHLNCN